MELAEKIDFEELEMRVMQSKKYEKRGDFLFQWWIIFLFVPIGYNLLSEALGRTQNFWEVWVVGLITFVPVIIGGYKSFKGFRKYIVRQDEWALFYCKSTLRWLNKKGPSEELRKEYRRNAAKNMEELISAIEKKMENWKFLSCSKLF